MMSNKIYIGDSVYCRCDGFHIVLTTENGLGPSNEIFLEQKVFMNLLDMAEKYFGVKIEVKEKVEESGLG